MPGRSSSSVASSSAYYVRNRLWCFGLRIMPHAFELGDLGARQSGDGRLENVAPRDRIVEPPHQVQRTIPVRQCLLPTPVMFSTFGVVADEQMCDLVAIVSGDALPEVLELGIGERGP